MRRYITLIFFVALALGRAWSQTIQGPSPVGINSTYTYVLTGVIPVSPTWTVTKGTILSWDATTATVKWTATGTGSLRISDVDGPLASISVTINTCGSVSAPTISSSYTCSGTTATLTATAGAGGTAIRWYFQNDNVIQATGTTFNPTMVVTTTFQGATYNTTNGCESARASIAVVIPGSATGTNAARCGTGAINLTAATGGNGNNVRWYTSPGGGSPLATATAYSPTISSTTNYYISTVNTTTGCETTSRNLVTATVNTVPTLTVTNNAPNIFAGSATNIPLASSLGGSSYNYSVSSNNNVANAGGGTSTTIAQSIAPADGANPGTVTYAATTSSPQGCASGTSNVSVAVFPLPAPQVNGVAAVAGTTYYNTYGRGLTLSVQSFYYGYQWYRDGAAINGATAASYAPTLPGTYTVLVTAAAGGPANTPTAMAVAQPNSQRDSVNAVSRTVFYKTGVDNVSPYTLQASDLAQAVAYSDGLGRVVQSVGVGQALPTGQAAGDLVMPAVPGRNGLADTTFLPYASGTVRGNFRKNAVRGSTAVNSYTSSEQYNFYQGTGKVATDAAPYARAMFRNTPDARVLEQGAPGTDWQPGSSHTVRNQKNLSTSTNYPVRQWKADGTTTGNYPNNTVWVTTLTDENNHNVNIYQDKLGRTVLKQVQATASTWLSTYYIYDNFGQLVYQLPPRAVTTLGTGTSLNANSSTVAKLIYQYKYDSAGQLIEKRVPGSAVMYMVYDKLGRVVLTQDGNQRAQGVWAFVKYDYKNRPVYTGTYTSAADRLTLQRQFANLNYTTQPWFETRAANAPYHGYSNTVFPTSSLQLLTVNYYDDYDFNYNNVADYAYDASDFGGTATNNTRGLATGSKKLILGTANWLVTVVFYDNLDRPLQTRSNNHLNLTVADRTSLQYFANNLSSKPQRVKVTHTGLTTVTTMQRYVYDNAWRTTAIYHTINSNAEQQVAAYEYNALGQVVDKKLHATGGGNFLQSVDYRYTIRGWLGSINNGQLTSDALTNDDTNDYFGMELLYNTADASGLGNSQNYNGNISAMKWKALNTAGAADQRSNKYAYDYSDRLTSATFAAHTGSAWAKETNTLNESMTYDANGNIVNLQRNQNNRGLSGATVTNSPMTVDQLTYTYTANANTVAQVEDAVATTVGVGDFKNGSTTTSEYTYNTDGDLTKDLNKGISSITYNVLGKPSKVTYSGTPTKTVTYTYYAGGNKIKMVTVANSVTTTTDYVGGFVYTNNSLSFFSSPEGRVVKNGANYEYQYAIADHQGNTRVLFTSAAPAAQPVSATMEATSNANFSNYINRSTFALFNRTAGGTASQLLNGGVNGRVGLAKTYRIYAGDKVKIEAYGKYTNASSTASNLSGFASALLAAYSLPAPAGGETGTPSAALNTWGGLVAGGSGGSGTVKAFVNIIVFDKNYKLIDFMWDGIDPAANQVGATPVVAHDYMMREYTAKEESIVYMYLSNESPTLVDVYFDDVAMTYTPGNIVQYNEYYPYGLQTANSWTRENTTQNNFLANGGTELNTTTSLYDLDYRNYDPILGRLNQVDPLADKYGSLSPYHFSFNNPVTFTDPSGAEGSPNPGSVAYGTYIPGPTGPTAGARGAAGDQASWMHGGGGVGGWYKVTIFWMEENGYKDKDGNFIKDPNYYYATYGYDTEMVYEEEPLTQGGGQGIDDWTNQIQFALANGDFFRNMKSFQFTGTNAKRAEDILDGGKFLHKGKIYSNKFYGNQYLGKATIQNSKAAFEQSAKYLKGAGKALGAANIAITGYQVISDISDGRYYSGGARTGVAVIAAGAAFIPVVGWGITIGIGVADAIWGDQFYNYVENKFGN